MAQLKERKLGFNVDLGMQVKPKTVDSFRGMVRYFDEAKLPYYRYALPEEKPLKVILRGVSVEIAEDDIKSDLADQGFEVVAVARFRRGAERTPIPPVMVQLKKT